jgi:hypothetical protein
VHFVGLVKENKFVVKMYIIRNFETATIGVIKYYIIGYVICIFSWFDKINFLIYEARSMKFQNNFVPLFLENA